MSARAAGLFSAVLAAAVVAWCAVAVAGAGAQEALPPSPDAGSAEPDGSAAPLPAPGRPGREVSLPESDVKDTFFAYFLGIVATQAPVDMDNEQMRSVLVEFKSKLDLPFDLISRVRQQPDPGFDIQVITLEFTREVDIPVPFALLFYHPGSILASRNVSFEVHRLPWTDPVAGGPPATAFDLALAHGTILVDIDDWLEALLSAHLEDSWIQHIVFFKWSRDWVGMLVGAGVRTSRARRAYFDFTQNRILFPPPDALARCGERLVAD